MKKKNVQYWMLLFTETENVATQFHGHSSVAINGLNRIDITKTYENLSNLSSIRNSGRCDLLFVTIATIGAFLATKFRLSAVKLDVMNGDY